MELASLFPVDDPVPGKRKQQLSPWEIAERRAHDDGKYGELAPWIAVERQMRYGNKKHPILPVKIDMITENPHA